MKRHQRTAKTGQPAKPNHAGQSGPLAKPDPAAKLRLRPQPPAGRQRTARQEHGRQAEERALAHLRQHGLVLIARNFHSRFGELDLIMRQAEVLVFVEVRARRSSGFASPADSIDRHKQRRLALAASNFLRARPRYAQLPSRFDVVCVIGADSAATLQWIPNAFLLEDCSDF